MLTLIIVFFMFLNILNVSSQDIYGFDFEDNMVPKYVTERNGVAEVSVKERITFLCVNKNKDFILDHNQIDFLHMDISKMVQMA